MLAERLDFEFESRESGYVGDYFIYSGLYADELTIEENRAGALGDVKEPEFRQFPTLIRAYFISGRNADKRSKMRHMRCVLKRLGSIELLRESEAQEP